MISIKGITKRYRNAEDIALDDIHLDIPKQSIFGILGPNGAGKTTLLSILSGLIRPSAGTFHIDRYDDRQMQAIRRIIGIVPQEYALYPSLTAYENLIYFGSLFNLEKSYLEDQIHKNLEFLGLDKHKHRHISTFSGGMKRRVNLIAGILHRPQVLFLDEPTVGVDVQSRKSILTFLNQLNAGGTTIIYTSHLMAEAEDFCTDIAIIDHGKILISGKPKNLINQESGIHSLEGFFIKFTGVKLRDV